MIGDEELANLTDLSCSLFDYKVITVIGLTTLYQLETYISTFLHS